MKALLQLAIVIGCGAFIGYWAGLSWGSAAYRSEYQRAGLVEQIRLPFSGRETAMRRDYGENCAIWGAIGTMALAWMFRKPLTVNNPGEKPADSELTTPNSQP